MRHRARVRPQIRRLVAIIAVLTSLVLVGAAVVYQINKSAAEQQRIHAAEQLATQPPSQPSQAILPESTPSAVSAPPETVAPVVQPPAPADVPPVLPVTHFSWPAAGLSVKVIPMGWQAGQVVDPPLDDNGFDPVAHLLEGSGESEAFRPLALAAHTCTSDDKQVCNETTFPFIKLSYGGWAVGQPASVVDAAGRTIDYTLVDRKVVDKSKAFSFTNDRCLLAAFTCNLQNPDGEITLVTFRRTGCGA